MFVWPRIGRDDEKRIYVIAMNADTYKFSVGHAAHWYYYMSGTVNTASEYAVTHAPTAATLQLPPALFAGIVADEAIPAGQYGKIQVYGYHDAVVVSNISVSTTVGPPFDSTFLTVATHTASKFKSLLLKPLAAFGNTHGVNASIGGMGVIPMSTTVTQTEGQPLAHLWPGGYAVPLSNPSATCTTNSSATIKAFIKCL